MDIAFAGTTALEVLRMVRANPSLKLEPAEGVDTSRFANRRGEMKDVNFLACGLAGTPCSSHPANIRVPDANRRNRGHNVHSLIFPKGLPNHFLLRLRYNSATKAPQSRLRGEASKKARFQTAGSRKSSSNCVSSSGQAITNLRRQSSNLPSELLAKQDALDDADLFDGRAVFIDCVPLALLTVANTYQRLIRSGRMGEGDAVVRLVELTMEFTGCYSRDPADPLGGDVIEDLIPCITVSEILSFLDASHGVLGASLLRKALRFARDGSRSAMETCLWIVFTMPCCYGFFGMVGAKLNVPITVDSNQRRQMKHRTLTPDIQWDRLRVAIEYQGFDDHSSRAARTEDNRRMNDYLLCGIRAFFVTFDDVRSVAVLDSLAVELATAMRLQGHPHELRRVRRLLEDSSLRNLRARHLAHLLPPVRR